MTTTCFLVVIEACVWLAGSDSSWRSVSRGPITRQQAVSRQWSARHSSCWWSLCLWRLLVLLRGCWQTHVLSR